MNILATAIMYIASFLLNLQLQSEEPKVELTVRTSRSELPKLFNTLNSENQISSLENRMSILETDVKVIKQTTEKTNKMVQNLMQQFGKAFETISDQMEKIYSQSREVDDHDVNQVTT